jgi:serine/threonine protein phosphatase PrpC
MIAPAASAPELRIDLGLLTHQGMSRPDNEDACGRFDEDPKRVLVIVADGVGGQEGGEEASRMAVEVTLSAFRESPVGWGAAKRLSRAVQQANIEIHDRAMIVSELRQMRTTITAAVVDGWMLHVAHVGDSRIYLARNGVLIQLTKDHTVAAGRARLGLLRADRVATHPERSTLTRCLGQNLIVPIDRISRPLQGEDRLLLCSDGLHGTLERSAMHALATKGSAEEACAALIGAANAQGAADNVTAVVVHVAGISPPTPTLWERVSRLIGR